MSKPSERKRRKQKDRERAYQKRRLWEHERKRLDGKPPNMKRVDVRFLDFVEANQCSTNVQIALAKFGGEMVTGWLVTDCLLWWQYIHHAIWKTPDGQLVDISPQFAGMVGDQAISVLKRREFLPDSAATFIGNVGRPPRYVPKPSASSEIGLVSVSIYDSVTAAFT